MTTSNYQAEEEKTTLPFHFSYYEFQKLLKKLETEEQGLDKFTTAYKRFGIHLDSQTNEIHVQEWAPGAKAMYIRGDFSLCLFPYMLQ